MTLPLSHNNSKLGATDSVLCCAQRQKYWSIEELALFKGLSAEDINFYIELGQLPHRITPVSKLVILPPNADELLDSLLFGQTLSEVKNIKPVASGVKQTFSTSSSHSGSKLQNLKAFIKSFKYGDKPTVLPGYKGMSIKASRKRKTVQLRENKMDKYFSLLSFNIDHVFTEENIETITKAHSRFRERVNAKMPWKDKNFLLSGKFREISTFTELFDFHKEGQTRDQVKKIERYQKRYLSEGYGDKLISNYCAESFKIDFLDRKPPEHQPSDRNEMIKIVSAAITKAQSIMNIKIDVQPLILKGERSRSDETDNKPPLLSTLTAFICKSYGVGKENLGLELIIQYMASTRVACTDALEWNQVKWKKLCVEVPNEKSKTGYRNHPIAKRLTEILERELHEQLQNSRLTKNKNGEPVYVFESDRRKGHAISNMDDDFNFVKAYLVEHAEALGFNQEQVEDIKFFTRHSIRDLVEDELMAIHASEAQKEKCLGRKPNALGRAYGNLDLKALTKLKDRMVEKAESEFPELKALFQRLIGQPKDVVLESRGVKKGVKNSL
jgi:hypothetical protein